MPFVAIGEEAIDASGRPNAFREAVIAYFAANDAEFDLRVQLCTDLDAMPIENGNKGRSQDDSPYRTVAKIRLPRQVAYDEARRLYFDERIGFQPAHALEEHRPLGEIMRGSACIKYFKTTAAGSTARPRCSRKR